MNFRHLGEPLRPLAEAVVEYFENEHGITHFEEEVEIHKEVDRPTLHAVTRDFHFLCIEFSETTPYPASLDRFVLDCNLKGLPVKLYVALPAGSTDPNYARDLNRARDRGLGVIEVNSTGVLMLYNPVSLSLAGLRRADKSKFPKKYRSALSQAESTFMHGDPAKGCSDVYDEIEALTRRIAIKTLRKKMWRAFAPGKTPPKINLKTAAWASVVEVLIEQLDPAQPPRIPKTLWARVLGITSHRNETGHKPPSKAALIKRDAALRTRFETAVELLSDLIQVSKSLRV